MPKPSTLIFMVDKYILENWADIQKENYAEYGKWNKIANTIKNLNVVSEDISNDYICRRYQCIKSKIKKGKTIEDLLKPPLTKLEKKKEYAKKYLASDKGKAMKERMAKNPWHIRNREYRKIKDKEYRQNNQEKERKRARKNQVKSYGITEEDYNKMFEEQDGCCAICKRHQSEFTKSLFIDHCHKTNKVRGLLCHNCNIGLGSFKDNIELMKNGINYLNK